MNKGTHQEILEFLGGSLFLPLKDPLEVLKYLWVSLNSQAFRLIFLKISKSWLLKICARKTRAFPTFQKSGRLSCAPVILVARMLSLAGESYFRIFSAQCDLFCLSGGLRPPFIQIAENLIFKNVTKKRNSITWLWISFISCLQIAQPSVSLKTGTRLSLAR